MPNQPPDFSPGDQFSASWLNSLLAFVRSCWLTSDGSILFTETPSGRQARVNLPQEADFRIDSGVNPYGGTEMQATAGGTWVVMTSGRVVTPTNDGLYERNNSATVPAAIVVHARRDIQSGCWIFDKTACTASTVAAQAVRANAKSPVPNPFALPQNPDVLFLLAEDVSVGSVNRSTVAPLAPITGLQRTDANTLGETGAHGLELSRGPS